MPSARDPGADAADSFRAAPERRAGNDRAASAYLSREPVQVGTLRGQDIGKALILGLLGIGTILATLGIMLDAEWPQLFLDVFKDMK